MRLIRRQPLRRRDDFDKLEKEFVTTFDGFKQAAKLQAKALKKQQQNAAKKAASKKRSMIKHSDGGDESPLAELAAPARRVSDEPAEESEVFSSAEARFGGRAAAGVDDAAERAPKGFLVLPQ